MNNENLNISKADIGLLLIRLMLAIVFIFHGSQKLFGVFDGHGIAGMAAFLQTQGVPFPTLSAILSASAEFFGGLALAFGILVRLAIIPMAFNMIVAALLVHWPVFSIQKGGMEYPLTLAIILIALGLTGAGNITVGKALIRLKS